MFCLHNLLGHVVSFFICMSRLSDKVETHIKYLDYLVNYNSNSIKKLICKTLFANSNASNEGILVKIY